MSPIPAQPNLSPDEHSLLKSLRLKRREKRLHNKNPAYWGPRIADKVAAVVGSWRFILIQSFLLILWISANAFGWVTKPWDPYPFILLNLALSFQAAYTAPIIMMSQNRQSEIDRKQAGQDYDINLKAELEIELLHQKIDTLRETEVLQLTALVRELLDKLPATKS